MPCEMVKTRDSMQVEFVQMCGEQQMSNPTYVQLSYLRTAPISEKANRHDKHGPLRTVGLAARVQLDTGSCTYGCKCPH